MCESGSRKRKIRHNSTVEMSKTVKGFFKKDDLDIDDSLSTSDWGLIIDDNYVSIKYFRQKSSPNFSNCRNGKKETVLLN